MALVERRQVADYTIELYRETPTYWRVIVTKEGNEHPPVVVFEDGHDAQVFYNKYIRYYERRTADKKGG